MSLHKKFAPKFVEKMDDISKSQENSNQSKLNNFTLVIIPLFKSTILTQSKNDIVDKINEIRLKNASKIDKNLHPQNTEKLIITILSTSYFFSVQMEKEEQIVKCKKDQAKLVKSNQSNLCNQMA